MLVNLSKNPWDQKVKILCQRGFYGETIARETGLTISQVRYRITKFNLRPSDFRRGYSRDAQDILNRINSALGTCRELKKKINLVR